MLQTFALRETDAQGLEGALTFANDDVAAFFGLRVLVKALLVQVPSLRRLAVLPRLRVRRLLLRQLRVRHRKHIDTFFDSGAGVSFANSTEIGDRVAHLEAAQPIAANLEDAAESAQGDLDGFFSGLNSDSLLNLKDGTVYTVSGDIADEVAALETLLNGDEDADNAVDNVTGFLESHDRAIADLDDLNGQIDHSVVKRDMPVASDAAPQLVSLDEADVDRLGEGSRSD